MRTINILIVVDCLGALSSNSLSDNTYIIDTNGYEGSWNEGTAHLVTVCQDGQNLEWAVCSINPSNDVSITSFSGEMVSSRICIPKEQGIVGAENWKGRVQTQGDIGPHAYTVNLSLNGTSMSFDAWIKVV